MWHEALSAACCALFAFGPAVRAQEPPRLEVLREWRWTTTTTVRCGAGDLATGLVALCQRESPQAGWQLVLYDGSDGREKRRFALAKEPAEVRFTVPGSVDVRLRDLDAFLSPSHWYRLRCDDGAQVGEPWPRDLREDDAVQNRKLLRGEATPGAVPCVFSDQEGVVSWWDGARPLPLVDRHARGLAMTPDGRFAVLWLATRIVVVPVAGGDVQRIQLPREATLALLPGDTGDEFWIVTQSDLRLLRAGSQREVRRVPHDVAGITGAALAPGGGPFAFARGGENAMLVDAATGRATELEARGVSVVWSLDGKRIVVGGGYPGRAENEPAWQSFSRDGVFRFALHEERTVWGTGLGAAVPIGEHMDWVAGAPQRVFVDGEPRQAGPETWPQTAAAFGPGEVVWTDPYSSALRVEIVELPSFHTTARFEAASESIGSMLPRVQLAVAPAARRIAITVGGALRVLAVPAARPTKAGGQK